MISEEEVRQAADQNLQDWLEQSIVPEELWPTIIEWLSVNGISDIYLEGHECIGAWWAVQEAKKMGFVLDLTKSSFWPSEWYPEGENWKLAQAKAKLKLVECWEDLLSSGALVLEIK